MATEHRIQLTGPELDERLAQVLTNEEDIGQEQQTRETTDEGMQEQIDVLGTRMDAQDTTNEQVATDIENLQKAIGTGGSVDDKIAAAVGAEATAREAADTALGGRITTLEAAVGTGGSVDERIATEATARANADTALGNRMTTLEGSVDDRLDQQDAAIGLLDGHKLEVVDALPTEQEPAVTPESDVIYRLVTTDSETGDVSYEDYMYNEDDLTTPKKIANYLLPGIDEEPTPGSKNLVKSWGVYDAVEKIVVETLGETTIQMPVKANTPTPGQDEDFVFTVDVSGLGIKSGTKITIGFTSELIDYKGVSAYYNDTYAGSVGNTRGTLAITLGADLETLTFKRAASGIIGTGIVLISMVSESSMYKHFSDEISAANAGIAATDAKIVKIENTSEIERIGEKTFSFSVANEKSYELPYIPKKGDVLTLTLTANANMSCVISGRSKTGTLWTSTTLTGTTATYEKTIEDADIDNLYLYTGSRNTATEVNVAIKNNHSSSKRLDAAENRLASAEFDIRTLNNEIGIPIAVNMDGSNFILPVGNYNASINVPEGSTVIQNLFIYDYNNVRLNEYKIRSSNDFSIEVPAEAARMFFYLGSSDTTGGNGVTSFTKINDSTVYVDSANGDDTSTTIVKTIGKALKLNKKNIILKDGIYDEKSLVMANGVKIMAEHTGKAVFIPSSSIVLTSDGTLMSGSSKVYQVSVDAAIATEVNKWRYIYQFGVDDPQTAIDNDFRLSVHGDLDYRCDFAAICHLASIEAVEATDYAAFYIDTTNSVLYYSRPSAVSASNYLFVPSSTKLFGSTSGKTFELQGLRIYGLVLSLNGSINAKVTDCGVFACGGGGCICFDSVTNLHLLRCEAARGETSYSATTGDGFNSHNSSANRSVFTLEDCWSHDNFNDGYSDHELSEGYILRGVYEYNCTNHGGGLTPAYGARDTIDGAICQCNKDDGIRYTGATSVNTTYESLIVKDVLIRNNANNGFATTTDTDGNAYVTCINVLSYDNGGYGFINVGNNTVTCLNCKAVGNTSGDFNGCTNR